MLKSLPSRNCGNRCAGKGLHCSTGAELHIFTSHPRLHSQGVVCVHVECWAREGIYSFYIPKAMIGQVGCAVLGRGAEPPQFWGLLIWLEPGLSHVTWVHCDATMCLAGLVCSILALLHFLRFGLFVL